MENDPYLDMIDDQWDNIIMMYRKFEDKEPIIEYEVTEGRIYSYPALDYVANLSERTRDDAKREYEAARKNNSFLLFVKDTEKQRLRSYVFDLPD